MITKDRQIAALRCWFKAIEAKKTGEVHYGSDPNETSYYDWAKYYAKVGIDKVTIEELDETSLFFDWDFIICT